MLNTYLPDDRRRAMAMRLPFPDRQRGSALFADIGGFTALAEAMALALGPQRGSELLTVTVNRIFDALIDAVDRRGGSVVGFAGDAMTCWFNDDDGRAGVACALAMQAAMAAVGQVSVDGMAPCVLGLKVSVVGGKVRRFVVGDPALQCCDVLAGAVIDRLATGETLCAPGQVLVDAPVAAALGGLLLASAVADGFARVKALRAAAPENRPAPVADAAFDADDLRPWVLAPVYQTERSGHTRFLAEFRQVAALFASFDGIDYDADDAGDRLDALMRGWIEIVTRHGGYLFDISIGDKGSCFLVVFGAPQAHGDDVRRAVAAADELRHAGVSRIGINAGRVYAGLYAGATRSVYRVAGSTVNIAARLMAAARAGQVLMSSTVGSSLDRRFAIQALEAITVKGRQAPVPVCELIGPAAVTTRLSEPRYLLPLVGRQLELARIDAALAGARSGCGQLLGLCAEAGLGKSRLVNETIQRAVAAGFRSFAGECQPHGTGIAYLPWQAVWNGLFGLWASDPAAVRREHLATLLQTSAAQAAALAPLMERLLDLPMPDNDTTRGMPALVRKQALEQVLVGLLRGLAGAAPLCIVLEDLHWVDALSRDLLAALAESIHDLPVLMVLAYRPLDAPLRLAGLQQVLLDELTPDQAAALVAALSDHLAPGSTTPELIDAVTARANGNPFYIEELMRYIVEHGGRVTDLPPSLESVILTRIDRLPAAQQLTVKVASVIGRRFPVRWLAGAFGDAAGGGHLAQDLAHIHEVGLIVADAPPPEQAFLFRHAVVRDVAYEMLGYALRQGLHEQFAAYLEQADAERMPVDLLAYHYGLSANVEKEAEYRRQAGELAIKTGACTDALAHVRRALQIVAMQPAGQQRHARVLELELLLGTILLVVDGQGSAQAKAVYDSAREHARLVPRGPLMGRAIFGLWTYYLFQGLMKPTEELAEEALALAQAAPDPGVRVMAHLAVAQTHMWTGRWRRCHDHYLQVMSHYDASQHQAYVTQYAQNPRFTASNSGFWALWALGAPDQAHQVAELAIADATVHQHPLTSVIAYIGRPVLAYLTRRHDLLAASVDEFVIRGQRAGNPFYIAFALAVQGYARVLAGAHDSGLAQLVEQDATMRTLGSNLVEPFITSLLAEAYLCARRCEEGLVLLAARHLVYQETGRISWLPDHLRLHAELRLAHDPHCDDEALDLLGRAMSLAREHEALGFELRAALTQARLLKRLGRHDRATIALADVTARFTEGRDTPDLRAAHVLLQ